MAYCFDEQASRVLELLPITRPRGPLDVVHNIPNGVGLVVQHHVTRLSYLTVLAASRCSTVPTGLRILSVISR